MSDRKIIAAIMERDERTLALVIQKYSRLLWKIAAAVLINASSAQDVEECVADVFIYLWQHPERYDPSKAKMSSWLSLVARSKAIDRYRRIARMKEVSMDAFAEEILEENLGYAEAAEAEEERKRLRLFVEELEEPEKELIIRRYYYDQKPAEIAAALNLPRKQVENKLYYARQRLKRRLERPDRD